MVSTSALRLGSRTSTVPVTKVIRYRSVGTAAATPRLSKTGPNPAAFQVRKNCTSVAPGGLCTISVTYRPTVHDKSAVLVIDDNTMAPPRRVTLTGVAPRR